MANLGANHLRSTGNSYNDMVAFQQAGGVENGRLCRAYVNFDGSGTISIRHSFNVSSISDNNTGDYTTNFSYSMSTSSFAAIFAASETTSIGTGSRIFCHQRSSTVSSVRTEQVGGDGTAFDAVIYSCAIFSN